MGLPDFLVVGAIKSGTTSLYYYLLQHPDVFLSPDVKESRFLAGLSAERNPDIFEYVTTITEFAEYEKLFEKASQEQAIGEVDPWCLYLYDQAIPRIKEYLAPSVRIIMCLRNPVERSYSHYYQVVKQGWETRPFAETVQAVLEGEPSTWYERAFVEAGLYYEQVKAYMEAFSRERVLVFLFEELRSDGPGVFHEICEFIGVDGEFVPDFLGRANVGGVPKNRALHNLLIKPFPLSTLLKPLIPLKWRKKVRQSLISRNLRRYPPMAEAVRRRLEEYYQQDVMKLQALIERDLTAWLD